MLSSPEMTKALDKILSNLESEKAKPAIAA